MCQRLCKAVESDAEVRARISAQGYVECPACNVRAAQLRAQGLWLEGFEAFARGLVMRADRFEREGQLEAAKAVRDCAADLSIAIKLANSFPVRVYVPPLPDLAGEKN